VNLAKVDRRTVASVTSLLLAVLLFVLAGPGETQTFSADPRTVFCDYDCFPVSHPWLLILAAACAIAGLIGLRKSLKSTPR
jgi:hypothetical protein